MYKLYYYDNNIVYVDKINFTLYEEEIYNIFHFFYSLVLSLNLVEKFYVRENLQWKISNRNFS